MTDNRNLHVRLEWLTGDDGKLDAIAISDAINALKEQEPKPVKRDMYGDAYCPWCSTEETIEMGVHKLHLGTRFCPYCGLAVKWDN